MDADFVEPTCEKCGAPITTGAMAILCPLNKECALRPDDPEGQAAVDEFREAFGVDTTGGQQGE